MHIPEWIKPAAGGAIAGAVAITIVSLSAGWLVTSGSANERAETQASEAVIAALTPICVAQFKDITQAREEQHLAALAEESRWQQGDYVLEHGWATMPGGQDPNDDVADACADQLMAASQG